MRTTVTVESDVEVPLRRLMRDRGLTFKQALNQSLRAGLGIATPVDVAFPTYEMGDPRVDLTHANRVAAALEDDEIVQKIAAGR